MVNSLLFKTCIFDDFWKISIGPFLKPCEYSFLQNAKFSFLQNGKYSFLLFYHVFKIVR